MAGDEGVEGYHKELTSGNPYDFDYSCGYIGGYVDIRLEMFRALDLELYNINVPVAPGMTYEDLSQIFQIEEMKKKLEQYDDSYWCGSMTNLGAIGYRELMIYDDKILCELEISLYDDNDHINNSWFFIEVEVLDNGIIDNCEYFFRLKQN